MKFQCLKVDIYHRFFFFFFERNIAALLSVSCLEKIALQFQLLGWKMLLDHICHSSGIPEFFCTVTEADAQQN